jgi:2-polyprenyl-3-methyl-5-hydroxy-6-metoxy-1,4-benzoquinol methylase
VTVPSAIDAAFDQQLTGCPACDAPVTQPFARRSGLQLARCPECTLVYANPQARAAVRARYLDDYDLAAHFKPLNQRKRVLFQQRLESLGASRRGSNRLCDVGCGDGQFLDMARLAGWESSGIELNPPAAARARESGATIYQGALEELTNLPWGKFNVVTCWDVLEHTPRPRLFAHRLARLVAPDGLLIVTTLNWASLVRRIRGMRWSMIADEHFTYWTRNALRRLLEREDMEFCSSTSFGLGRDLVSAFDGLSREVQRVLPTRGRASPHSRPGWDTRPAVLLAERAANVVLRVTGSGVGLAATFRAPPELTTGSRSWSLR